MHAHTPGPTSLKSTRPKHNLFCHFPNSTSACRARWWAKKRMWAAGLSGGQDWATQATSEKLVFLQPGDFCHPDTGPRPAAPDLLPIFGPRDLDSKSAPGSASDAAAVIPRVHLLTQLLHHLTLLWKQIYLILASSEKAEWEPVRFHSVTN